MKTSKRTSLLAYAISFELLVGPIIPHVAYAKDTKSTHPKDQKQGPSTAEYINFGLQMTGQILNQVGGRQNSMSPQLIGDMRLFQQQMTPQEDKYFSYENLFQERRDPKTGQMVEPVPGLKAYLALNNLNPNALICKTLPTTMSEIKPEVCRVGITSDKGDPQVQMDQAFTYYNQFLQTSKMYDNFSASSNSAGQAFGIGCMENAMNILNGFFKYRIDELDKLVTNLEALNNKFKEDSRADLDAIKESVAVLEGGNSLLTSELRSKRPDLFDFKKKFNNPACNSMFGDDSLNKLGRSNGLNAINTSVQETLNDKKGRYSGASYSKSHQAVLDDIDSVAGKVAKYFELNFANVSKDGDYNKFLTGLNPQSISSTTGIMGSVTTDTFSDVQTRFMTETQKINEDKQDLFSSHSGTAKVLGFIGQSSSANFSAEVRKLQRQIQNECFQSMVDVSYIRSRIKHTDSSNFANENSQSILRDKIESILSNENTSIDEKIREIKQAEADDNNKYEFAANKTYTVEYLNSNNQPQTKVVNPGQDNTVSKYISNLKLSCDSQFTANKLSGGNLTGAEVIAKLNDVNNRYKTLARNQANEASAELRNRLKNCSSPEIANNSVNGSCTSDLFNTSAPGFCAAAAFNCSKNMQACNKEIEDYTKEIKDKKTLRTNNYKALLEKNKNDIVKLFDNALAQYMQAGDTLRGVFGAGFTPPAGIRRQIDDDNQKYLQDVVEATKSSTEDGALLLENPDAYVQMFKENVDLLKESVRKQQDQILGGESVGENSGLLAKHIEQTRKNYKAVADQTKTSAEQCLAKHDGQIDKMEQSRTAAAAEAAKMQSELGEKVPYFCGKFGTASDSSTPSCSGDIQSLGQAAMKAAMSSYNRAQDQDTVAQWMEYCENATSYSENTRTINADVICTEPNKKTSTTLEKLCKNYYELLADDCKPINNDRSSITCAAQRKEVLEELTDYYIKNNNDKTHSEGSITWTKPSFCPIANDDYRNTGKAIFDGLQQGMQQPYGASRN